MEQGKSNCPHCKALIRLCAGMDFFPTDAAVRELLIERLHRHAKNHAHAKAMIDRWLDTETMAPKVADLMNLSVTVGAGPKSLPLACETCAEFGGYWVITERGSTRCACARGQALWQMDRQRDEQQGAVFTTTCTVSSGNASN